MISIGFEMLSVMLNTVIIYIRCKSRCHDLYVEINSMSTNLMDNVQPHKKKEGENAGYVGMQIMVINGMGPDFIWEIFKWRDNMGL